ncbi:hypothetical protein MUK42_15606 [Musa troglodytarum]|uniref:Uncharacterized protein n=1 Tax=Musa troglodytarum TaxID=320322 RepID=A0A9E7KZP0_9LILI|nr:hypothetical protein MUK42_15606 [Musa troglodytarum]
MQSTPCFHEKRRLTSSSQTLRESLRSSRLLSESAYALRSLFLVDDFLMPSHPHYCVRTIIEEDSAAPRTGAAKWSKLFVRSTVAIVRFSGRREWSPWVAAVFLGGFDGGGLDTSDRSGAQHSTFSVTLDRL